MNAGEQGAVTNASTDPQTIAKCRHQCAKHAKKVCADDGKIYWNDCYASCAKARPLHVGRCQCSRKPAATCQVLGRECRLSQETSKAAANNVPVAACSCCKGLICWAGPVVRAGQVLGRCLNETGPLPIG